MMKIFSIVFKDITGRILKIKRRQRRGGGRQREEAGRARGVLLSLAWSSSFGMNEDSNAE